MKTKYTWEVIYLVLRMTKYIFLITHYMTRGHCLVNACQTSSGIVLCYILGDRSVLLILHVNQSQVFLTLITEGKEKLILVEKSKAVLSILKHLFLSIDFATFWKYVFCIVTIC